MRYRTGYALLRDRGDYVNQESLQRRLAAAWLVLLDAGLRRPERRCLKRRFVTMARRHLKITNRRRHAAFRRKRLARPDAAALEFSG